MTKTNIPGSRLLLFVCACLLATPVAAGEDGGPGLEEGEFDPSLWHDLVARFATESGVDYAAWAKHGTEDLDAFLADAATWDPRSTLGKEPKIAYYLNVYNAAAVRRILANYPVASVRDIDGFFDSDIVELHAGPASLDELEAQMAVFCRAMPGALLCLATGERGRALLAPVAYTSQNLLKTTQMVAIEAGTREVRYEEDSGTMVLPSHLETHMEVLESGQNGLAGLLANYVSLSALMKFNGEEPRIRFEKVDGSLNERVEEAH